MQRPVDIQSYEHLQSVDEFAQLPEAKLPLGVLLDGPEQTGRAGSSFDPRGVRKYQPGDHMRHINYQASLRSGEWMTSEWEDEKSTNVLVVSDMPRHAYANTPGENYSSRALGMLAAHAVMRMAINDGSPVSAVWTNGFETKEVAPMRHGTDDHGVRQVLSAGIDLSLGASRRYSDYAERPVPKKKLFKKSEVVEAPDESNTVTNAMERAQSVAKKLLRARIVVISDFRQTAETGRGHDWSAMLESFGKANQVITIEITNPLLRGLNDTVENYQAGAGGVMIEDGQREAYAKAVAERNARITDTLQQSSDVYVSLDTAKSNWTRSLADQLKS